MSMSTNTIEAGTAERTEASAGTAAAARLTALGRAELTLLCRNKTALFMSLIMPIVMAFAMKQAVSGLDLSGTGLSVGTVLLPATLGYVLLSSRRAT